MPDHPAPAARAAPDQAARDRIGGELDATLFVEAGAGSGKTTALVERIVGLVVAGHAQLASIAAITFTEKAGAELRDRVRHALQRRASATPDGEVADRCREALDQLDAAAIGTLHAFAQRLLTEHPVEARLPPRVEVLDEVSSGVELERRWTSFRDELLADADLERSLLLLFAAGVPHQALRALAVAFDDNWDLVAEHVPESSPDPPPVRARVDAALADVTAVCAERAHCTKPGDRLHERLDAIEAYLVRLRALDDEVELLEALAEGAPVRPSFRVGNCGAKGNWRLDVAELRERVAAAGEALLRVRGEVSQACARRIGSAVRRFTLAAAEERRAAGRLEFHDLLVLARQLLRDPEHGPEVRAHLHGRYRRLLLDEFQDTDPIQIELAVRITAADPASEDAGRLPWDEVPVARGALFVVGDPKQSIYRFRRADIATFLRARARFGPEAGGPVELTANFRTGGPVIDWVNHALGALMGEAPAVDLDTPSQPDYVALRAVRPGPGAGPPVAVLGRALHAPRTGADELRTAEAVEVAATVARAVTEGWSVAERDGTWRPARLGDVTILVPARTSLPFLEEALDASGIPYRAESSSLVYATRAVRDLLMVLRAVDDPTDQLRTVAALRTPLLGCGDDDLFRWKVERRGSWSWFAPAPAPAPEGADADDPVGAGLAYLAELHGRRRWQTPSELLDRVATDRRALELGFAEGRPRDVWRRLRFVVDQARAWSEATGGSLREYLHWVDQQSAEGARVAESVLPETDDDAVRIMTIHAAKGLEFPITVVSGMSTVPQSRRAPAEVVFPPQGSVGYRFGRHVTTDEYEAYKPIDEQMGYDERIRLLYVACTRARDHLVVSLHRKARASAPEKNKRTNAELLLDGTGVLLDTLPDAVDPGSTVAVANPVLPAAPPPPPPLEEWATERDAALARGSRPTAVAATALTDEGVLDGDPEPDPGLDKRPRDLDLPPWLKGRYGSAVGRAVHGVLQTIDLATGEGLDAAVTAQSEAEAVPGRADAVRRLVRDALASASVREAASAPHWREVYACAPTEGGRLLEGYVDLLYRTSAGLVVVDHKTSASADPADIDRRLQGYRLQGASYAFVVGVTTGEPVTRVTFLFLTPEGAIERHLDDLDGAVAEVRALVAAGEEVVLS
ncbi:MAG: AAA family ATPase [Acidimicrobiia bacterium]|nr:AAA family ATPase [Acidimicrobiia bacterium]